MKKMLLLLIVSLCFFAWRSEDYLRMAGFLPPDPAVEQKIAAELAAANAKMAAHKPMTPDEFARLSKTDPEAYKKFMASRATPVPKGEIDKLMNFFKTGKFE
jgi:hypothetical protein